MVLLFHIHFPNIVIGAEDIFHRQDRCQHRVILVVVLVHTVTANKVHVGSCTLEIARYVRHVLLIGVVVIRVGLLDPNHIATFHL